MRIVCDSCGTKYSIPDDRVKNRPFKIRCKKCSYTIVVDSAESSEGESDAIWYVVINGEQLGPLASRDVEEYFYSQQIDLETYIWRDGFPDWIQLSAASEFAQLLNAAPAAAPATTDQAAPGDFDDDDGATRQVNLDEVYRGPTGIAPSPANEENDATRIVAMAPQHDAAPSPLDPSPAGGGFDAFGDFGAQLESQVDDDQDEDDGGGIFGGGLADLGSSAPLSISSASSGGDLVGARSENSVLFSLSNLQAIGKPSASAGGDLPTTEGSGLIDIKALAASQAAAPSDSRQSFGGGGGDAFDASVIPVPAMMPMGTRKSNTGLIIGISAGAVVLIGLIVTVIILALGGDDKNQAPQAKADKEEEETIEAPDLGVGAGQAGQVVAQNGVPGVPGQIPPGGIATNGAIPVAGQPLAGQPLAGQPLAGQPIAGQAVAGQVVAGDPAANAGSPEDAATGAEEAAESDDASKSRRGRRRASSSRRRSSSSSDDTSTAEVKPAEKPKDKPKASGGAKRGKGEIMDVVKKNFGKIRTCSHNADMKGKMKVDFDIKDDGRTSGVSIASSEFNGTRVGACVVKVFQGMRFSDTGESQSIKNFPVAIN